MTRCNDKALGFSFAESVRYGINSAVCWLALGRSWGCCVKAPRSPLLMWSLLAAGEDTVGRWGVWPGWWQQGFCEEEVTRARAGSSQREGIPVGF